MAEPFLGEIRMMSFVYPPRGWALCNGQLLPINQNQALFALLGVMYGGNGQTTFALPNLQGRVPMHMGGGFNQGQVGGEVAHTLTVNELPMHLHAVRASSAATGGTPVPTGNFLGGANNAYHSATNLTPLRPQTVTSTGGSQAHVNESPYLTISFCIALQGIFPSRN
ncbi:MAG TPA: tail fiber protein [Frankiaceae bacterium]|nr:tail fiber protein [Frankiaceae bacterium]